MAFPTTVHTSSTSALSAVANAASDNGLGAVNLLGQDAIQASLIANMCTTLPNGCNVGRTALATVAGAGITGGANTVYKVGVTKQGGIIITNILVDLSSLQSSTTDLDVIGRSTTETVVLTSGGNWTIGRQLGCVADSIAADSYLYLANGAAGTVGTYSAGRLLITLWGV